MDAAWKEIALALATIATGLVVLAAKLAKKAKVADDDNALAQRLEKLEALVHEMLKEQTAQGKQLAALEERTSNHGR